MSSLREALRRARESAVTVNGRTFTIRRPTAEEYGRWASDGGDAFTLIRLCVVGWGEPTELDLGKPGGTDAKVPFSADDFSEWIGDQPSYWKPLIDAINSAIDRAAEKREVAAKN